MFNTGEFNSRTFNSTLYVPPKRIAKYSDHFVEQGEAAEEIVVFSPAITIGYNSSDEMIQVKKETAGGATYVREIVDPDVTDYEVDRWQVFSRYRKTRGG